MKMNSSLLRLVASALIVFACTIRNLPQAQQSKEPAKSSETPASTPPGPGGVSLPNADPFPSTYKPFPRRTTLIRNATVMTAAGPSIQNGSVLLRDGKIAEAIAEYSQALKLNPEETSAAAGLKRLGGQ